MSITTLNVRFGREARYDSAIVNITNLVVSNGVIEYEEIDVILDGNKYDGEFHTFVGDTLNAEDLFRSMLNAYLRDDVGDYENFSDEWNVFSCLKDLKEYSDGHITKLPIYDGIRVDLYNLALESDNLKFYSYNDNYVVFDNDFVVVTDYECFYSEAMYEVLGEHLLGVKEALYIGYDAEVWIENEREDIIAYYRDSHTV